MKISVLLLSAVTVALSAAALGADLGAPAPATPPSGVEHLSLAEAVAEAIHSNPSLQARTHVANAAASDARAANRGRLGELNAVASYSYFSDDQILRPMSRELVANGMGGLPWDRDQLHYGLAYQVPLFLGGRLVNQVGIARLEAQKSEALREGSQWQVRFNAVSLYAAAQALDRVEAALAAQIETLGQTKANIDRMVAIGKRPEIDRLKVEDDLAATQAQLAAAKADRTRVGALLLALLGRDPASPLVVDSLPDSAPAPSPDRGELRELAMRATSVRVAALDVDQAARAVSVARSAFLPQVVGSANYLENTGLGINRTLDTWGASVGVVIPIFSGTSDAQRLHASKERQAASREALAQAQLQASASLQDALARLDSSYAAVAAGKARVAASGEAARIEAIRYQTGAGSIEDLLRTLARKEAAFSALALARADQITAAERINTLVEKEIFK